MNTKKLKRKLVFENINISFLMLKILRNIKMLCSVVGQ